MDIYTKLLGIKISTTQRTWLRAQLATAVVSLISLRNWSKQGRIEFKTTASGHKHFDVNSLASFHSRVSNFGPDTKAHPFSQGDIYCRVSSAKQKHLVKQVQAM